MLKITPKPIDNGRILVYESLADKKVLLIVNLDEIPDLIVYFADEEKDERRHCCVLSRSIKSSTFQNH
jgi:hypothetical protein